jgi:hypothetical protein
MFKPLAELIFIILVLPFLVFTASAQDIAQQFQTYRGREDFWANIVNAAAEQGERPVHSCNRKYNVCANVISFYWPGGRAMSSKYDDGTRAMCLWVSDNPQFADSQANTRHCISVELPVHWMEAVINNVWTKIGVQENIETMLESERPQTNVQRTTPPPRPRLKTIPAIDIR